MRDTNGERCDIVYITEIEIVILAVAYPAIDPLLGEAVKNNIRYKCQHRLPQRKLLYCQSRHDI
jgi:hypothetical protein